MFRRSFAGPAVAVVVVLLAGCGSDDDGPDDAEQPAPSPTAEQQEQNESGEDGEDGEGGEQTHPDVVDVTVDRDGDTYTFDVTISSPYDTPERYADGWRVVGPDGTVYGEHTLGHDHADEQPFTRTQTGVEIPDGVTEVTVEGRDLENGFGGGTKTVPLPNE